MEDQWLSILGNLIFNQTSGSQNGELVQAGFAKVQEGSEAGDVRTNKAEKHGEWGEC